MKAKELYNLQKSRKALEKAEEELSKELRAMTNEQPYAVGGISYTFDIRVGAVDYSIIPALKGVELDQFRKPPVKSWRLRVEYL